MGLQALRLRGAERPGLVDYEVPASEMSCQCSDVFLLQGLYNVLEGFAGRRSAG